MLVERSVETDGAQLNCRAEGPGDGAQWIVFSNSLATDLGIWDAQRGALADRWNLLRYDQRGHGGSSATKRPLDFETLGRDLLALLDTFDVPTCTFVGLSMGVPTGLSAYGKMPTRFERLVFVDGMAKTAPTGAQAWQERLDFAQTEGMQRVADDTVERWLQAESRGQPAGLRLKRMVGATSIDGYTQCVRALQDYDYASVVSRIRCPLLAIAGAEDGTMPATMQRVFGQVPGAQIERIPGAGHVPNFERPAEFNALLLRFLNATRL